MMSIGWWQNPIGDRDSLPDVRPGHPTGRTARACDCRHHGRDNAVTTRIEILPTTTTAI
jgi:hypothetical protein